MSQSTGMAMLPAVEASLAALGLSAEDGDLAIEATRLATAIDESGGRPDALRALGPRLLNVLASAGATPAARAQWRAVNCIICAGPIKVARRRIASTCSADCSERYRQARIRNREHVRRSAVSDITPEQELAMRRRARKCPMPGCGVNLSNKPGQPNSKHLDHIIPLNPIAGGTHTHGNVRIICASCNLKRPKDGSDYSGPVTLWAQGEARVGRPDGRATGGAANKATCRKGLHPWTPENIAVVKGGKRQPVRKVCRECRKANERRNRGSGRLCECGEPLASGGHTAMCPGCTEAAARKAAELHAAGGLNWKQVAALVGYGSGEGARFAAKRIGYVPADLPKSVKPAKRCQCGAPVPTGNRGMNHSRCDGCIESAARRAVHLRTVEGWTLKMIADELGCTSITTVTNLMKTVMPIESHMGRPRITT